MLVEEREDPAAPRRRGGVVVRERDLPLGQYDMASAVNTRMKKDMGENSATKFEHTENQKKSGRQTKEDSYTGGTNSWRKQEWRSRTMLKLNRMR